MATVESDDISRGHFYYTQHELVFMAFREQMTPKTGLPQDCAVTWHDELYTGTDSFDEDELEGSKVLC